MAWFGRDKTTTLISAEDALPGRVEAVTLTGHHAVYLDRRIQPPFPDGLRTAVFGMGCFWGAERLFWRTPGVYSTAVGYAGGHTPNPTYEEVCTGLTGHTEAVLVVYDPAEVSYEALLKVFWEGHNPTEGMRQGADVGTQYRSAIYWTDEAQRGAAEASARAYQAELTCGGHGTISTEIAPLGEFYYAEEYHQQYLSDAKNPYGYCGLGGTGVTLNDPSAEGSCPTGILGKAVGEMREQRGWTQAH
jgi:peptide-methionine (S)-S-oxide reductase